MIPGIKNGKIKFHKIEDSLTSSIFQLLSYLPDSILSKIITETLHYQDQIPIYNLSNIEFWPKWNPIGTTNKNFVEPDVFMNFEHQHIIVEAKRFDEKGQSPEQWKNELIGYFNEYKNSSKELIFWALGGINNWSSDSITVYDKNIKIFKSTWTMLLTSIRKNLQENNSHNQEQLFHDLIYSFRLHNFFVGEWLDEDSIELVNHKEYSLKYFINEIEKYDSHKWFSSFNHKNKILTNIDKPILWKTPQN